MPKLTSLFIINNAVFSSISNPVHKAQGKIRLIKGYNSRFCRDSFYLKIQDKGGRKRGKGRFVGQEIRIRCNSR